MSGVDFKRYAGAGVMYCRTRHGVIRKAAAAWLIGGRDIVVLNAHNFYDRKMRPTTAITNCHYAIGGQNYDFDPLSLRIGAQPGATRLEINNDWALARLVRPVDNGAIEPQPIPRVRVPTGRVDMRVVMVSPAGHENFGSPSSIEACVAHSIDAPSRNGVRRIRHDCSDGYGGSGSGIFDSEGRLLAMHSASLNINLKRPFDPERHYGSAIVFEGDLVEAIRAAVSAEAQDR